MIAAIHCPECHLMFTPEEMEDGCCPECGATVKRGASTSSGTAADSAARREDILPVVREALKVDRRPCPHCGAAHWKYKTLRDEHLAKCGGKSECVR